MKAIYRFFKRLFCRHEKGKFIRNFYGDEIIFGTPDFHRSMWTCKKCDGVYYSHYLHNED